MCSSYCICVPAGISKRTGTLWLRSDDDNDDDNDDDIIIIINDITI
jgi:hypothetical protein